MRPNSVFRADVRLHRRLHRAAVCLLAVSAVATFVRAAPLQQVPQGDNVLVGRVLDVGTGDGIGGAQVSLVGYLEPDGSLAAGVPRGVQQFFARSFEKRVVTTADGTFVFRGLPAGRLRIFAVAPGYVRPDGRLRFVDLEERDRPTSISLHLWQYGSISGRVIDARGDPVVGVPVLPMRKREGGGNLVSNLAGSDVLTDDRGVYRIPDLRAGSYLVAALATSTSIPAGLAASLDAASHEGLLGTPLWRELSASGGSRVRSGEGTRLGGLVFSRPGPPLVLAPDGTLLTYPTTFHPGTASPSQAAVIDIAPGESRTDVDIPIAYGRAYRVSGVVAGPDGPAGNLLLRLLPPGSSGLLSEPAGVASAVTAADGAFAFPVVAPGQYQLTTFRLPVRESGNAVSPEDVVLWAQEPVTVTDADIDGLAVALKPGIRLRGRVEFAGAGRETPGGGSDIRLGLGLRPVGAGIWLSSREQVQPDGTFGIAAPPGRYLLSVSVACDGGMGCVSDWKWSTTTRGGVQVPYDLIELGTTDISGLVLTLSREVTRVSGSVVDESGTGDPAAVDVVVFPADTMLWREDLLNYRRVRTAPATAAGGFEFDGLAPGEYYIVAVESWYASDDPRALERLIPGARKITVSEGQATTANPRLFRPQAR